MVDSIQSITKRIDSILGDIQAKGIPARAAVTLDEAAGALRDLRKVIAQVQAAGVPEKASRALVNLDKAIDKLYSALSRVDGDNGLIASPHSATDAFGNAGNSANEAFRDLDETMRDVGEAARAVRELAKGLDRDPDMLLKGKTRGEK
jgi:paraquat-inducible protein B